jgi:hypothetical protein
MPLGDTLLQVDRGIKELRLIIGLETHHDWLSMNHGIANHIKTSASTCNHYLGNNPYILGIVVLFRRIGLMVAKCDTS